MEDPWGAGAWGTPAKTKALGAGPTLELPPELAAPPKIPGNGVEDADDPWSAPPSRVTSTAPPAALETSSPITPSNAFNAADTQSSPTRPALTTGWSDNEGISTGAWGASDLADQTKEEVETETQKEVETVPSVPLPRVQEQSEAEPVWALNSPTVEKHSSSFEHAQDEHPESFTSASLPEKMPLPASPSADSPIHATPRTSFAAIRDSSPASYLTQSRAIEDSQAAFSSPSRSLGHDSPDFGGFGGFEDGASTAIGGFGIRAGGFSPDLGLKGGFESSGVPGSSSGFGGDDPWGSGGNAWGGRELSPETGFAARVEEQDESDRDESDEDEEDQDADEQEGDGWGGAVSRNHTEVKKSGMQSEWELAQHRIQVQAERVPEEKVEKLRTHWREVTKAVIGLHQLEGLTPEEEERLEATVRKLAEESSDALRSLTNLPPDINTYPPVLSNFQTHEAYQHALSRPNPDPASSLLTVTLQRRANRMDSLDPNIADESWTSRSRLGEPDVPKEATPSEEARSSRWSFWGKKAAPETPLITSGGGILEVKSTSLNPVPGLMSPPMISPLPPVSEQQQRPSISSRSASIASAKLSRPTSPIQEEEGRASPGGMISNHPPLSTASTSQPMSAGASSSRSRWFGRFRKPQPSTEDSAGDPKDLELNDADFGFLSEVPSIQPPQPQERGMADLLSLENNGISGISSLENMLANNKPTLLPAPLAPPPSGGPRAPTYSRQSSGRFVAKMKAPTSDMDLLGGLDFDSPDATMGPQSTSNSPLTATATGTSANGSMWDEFLAPAAPPKSITPIPQLPQRSTATPPIIPGPPISRPTPPPTSSTPPILPGPPGARKPSTTIPPPSQTTTRITAPRTSTSDDFADFDFDTPQAATSSTVSASFDDFGDFDSFTTPRLSGSSGSVPNPQSIQTTQPALPSVTTSIPTPVKPHFPVGPGNGPALGKSPLKLDHTPTIALLSDASAIKGRRWPAPPSPIAPQLEPPPKADQPISNSGSGGFPFLSPPPPGRAASNTGLGMGMGDLLTSSNSPMMSSEPAIGGFARMGVGMNGSVPMQPSASSTSNTSAGSGVGMATGKYNLGLGIAPSPVGAGSRSVTPSQAQLPMPSTQQQQQQPGGTASKGGLSAQDLSFFDSL